MNKQNNIALEGFQPARPKEQGAYYTPDAVARSLVSWAVRRKSDRLLDPSCGDGRFIALHSKSVGIEQEVAAAQFAISRAPAALVHEGDFFAWAENTRERFECAAGNPPFIRYQLFKGETRRRALELCALSGAKFSGLSSSWALFLVATASLLKPGGRMAFVVPAEIGHAPYSAPLLSYLAENFGKVQIIAVREKLFPELSEDCWLLYAENYGAQTQSFEFTALDRFEPSKEPPRPQLNIDVEEWRGTWNQRLRPFLMPKEGRELYRSITELDSTSRFRDVASIGIGYVSGANQFFHLRPSEIERWGIPEALLQPTVRNGRSLPPRILNKTVLERWKREDAPAFLLKLTRDMELPSSVKAYLETEDAKSAQQAYKCRVRNPWYAVPDVKVPDFFLTYMSGRQVSFVRNDARCSCTNSLHYVRVKNRSAMPNVLTAQRSPFFQLSCELEGHPLGGGMLKLEPREASNIAIPSAATLATLDADVIQEATMTLQSWRHYAH